MPSAYAYPYDLSPSGRVRESLTAEMTAAESRIQQNPNDGLDRAFLAQAYLKMARITGADQWYEKAEASAQKSLENLPFNNDGALLALAKVAEAKHDFATAARFAEQASGGEAIALVVKSKLATGQVAEANAAAEKLVAFSPSMGSLTLRALARQARGDHAGALSDFQQAIAVEQPSEVRGSALTRTLLGKLYAEQGQDKLAESLYREALKIEPNYPQTLLNFGELRQEQGRYRSAEKFYKQVDDPLALLGLAKIKRLRGQETAARIQWAAAETILRDKIAANPLDHRRELAVLLLERGDEADRDEALTLMQAEVKNRRNAETLNTFAWALSEVGRGQEAQVVIEEAILQNPQNKEIFIH
ncbi:MAG: tetratricopeptide repeat protein [Cyanobacteria bacterium P01_F01_bin.143]